MKAWVRPSMVREPRRTQLGLSVENQRGGFPRHLERSGASSITMDQLRVLLVEDQESDAELLLRELRRAGRPVQYERVEDAAAMRAALERGGWDAIVCDWSLPAFSAQAALHVVKEMGVDLPFIIASGSIDDESAIDALRAGAHDFVLKNNLARLTPAIEREMRERAVRVARKRAEEEVRLSAARYRALFEASPLPKFVYEVDTLALLDVNEAAVRHYGYSRQELSRMTFDGIRRAEDSLAPRHELRREGGASFDRIWRHVVKDGREIQVTIESQDIDFEGRTARLVIATDVTERLRAEQALRATEEQLRQAQKLEAIGSMAGGIAHDFNNMLSVVLSYANLAMEGLREGDPLREDLQEIRRAGERAAEMTRQLLAFSRKQMLEPRVIDPNGLLTGMEKMLARLLGEDIKLSLHTPRAVGRVLVDPSQFEQVIMNLVVNARDAMPEGGTLSIETADVDLDEPYAASHMDVTPGPHVMIVVSDTGAGMDRATMGRIFEPFFTTKEPGKGTGLGLSTVFGIVKQSGGHLWVYSEVGQGTTFKIYLPRTEVAEPRHSDAPTVGELTGTETILLVEDEDQVRALMRTVLKRNGYQVLEAQNGGEALLIAEEFAGTIHLLVTDVIMPRMSGRRVAERLSKVRPGMPVLYVSGYTENMIVQHGVVDPGVTFLQKPVTPEVLLRKVRQVLDRPEGKV